jgi:hypothetical protein
MDSWPFPLLGIGHDDERASGAHPFGQGKAPFLDGVPVAALLLGIAGRKRPKRRYGANRRGRQVVSGTVTAAGAAVPIGRVQLHRARTVTRQEPVGGRQQDVERERRRPDEDDPDGKRGIDRRRQDRGRRAGDAAGCADE